jgi:hypothetical protein
MKAGRSFNVATMSQAELLARKAQEKKLEMGDFYKFQRIDEKKKSMSIESCSLFCILTSPFASGT